VLRTGQPGIFAALMFVYCVLLESYSLHWLHTTQTEIISSYMLLSNSRCQTGFQAGAMENNTIKTGFLDFIHRPRLSERQNCQEDKYNVSEAGSASVFR
jgi:hypothetical protein